MPQPSSSSPRRSPSPLSLFVALWLTALLTHILHSSPASADRSPRHHQHQLPPTLTREEKIFLTHGIHVHRYNLTQSEASSSVTVSQRVLLRNRQSYAALKSLFRRRSLFHSFLRSLAATAATSKTFQQLPDG